ncbi:hypothetical protein OIO90_001720 [Microbotryomycetes sp. JL221]|nr:hypothetical protein OIO90_001720 [Microbotryomycetes sp. JL221]
MATGSTGSVWLDAVLSAPHDTWNYLEHSDNLVMQYIFQVISSEPALALWAKIEIWMSSKARSWAERRHNNNERVAASRRQADAIWADETKKAEQAGTGSTATKTSAAPAASSSGSKPSSGANTPNKRKGKK